MCCCTCIQAICNLFNVLFFEHRIFLLEYKVIRYVCFIEAVDEIFLVGIFHKVWLDVLSFFLSLFKLFVYFSGHGCFQLASHKSGSQFKSK